MTKVSKPRIFYWLGGWWCGELSQGFRWEVTPNQQPYGSSSPEEAYIKYVNYCNTKCKFLWLPKKVEGKWRWLCSVTAYMRKVKRASMPPEGIGSFEYEDWIVEEYKL